MARCLTCGMTRRAPRHHGRDAMARCHPFAEPPVPPPEVPAEISMADARIMRHMVGAESHIRKRSWGFRNHFAAGPDGTDRTRLEALVERGLVRKDPPSKLASAYALTFFHVTAAGCAALGLTADQTRKALE